MTRTVFVAAALVLAVTLPIAPAQATGAPRTFVSAAGSDANTCTNVATPCRHLAAAYAATAPNGEIYVLDPANYGSLTITGSVSIEGHGWASIAPVANNAAITINANAGDKINIIGVVLDGTALTNTTGIQFNAGGSLTVRDSVIRNFTDVGIQFGPNSSTPIQLFVSNTLISDNGGDGIQMTPSGTGTASGVLNRVQLESNFNGLEVTNDLQIVNVTVANSVSANNAADGILASSQLGNAVSVTVRNSTVAGNGFDGLGAQNAGATIRTTRSTITENNTAWANTSSGAVVSYADNNIDDNGSANTEPPNPLTYK